MAPTFYVLCAALLSAPAGAFSATVGAEIDLDSPPTPFPHYWKRCFGSGHTGLGVRADWREHMERAAAELGVQGLRMHGVMDDDLSICPRKGEYHFYSLDLVYDNMLQHGVKPIVELSFMPKAFVTCGEGTNKTCSWAFRAPGSYRGLQMPPDDWNDWFDLVRALAQHMVDRHGLAEVSTWRWEVWNELWGMPYPHPYLELYNASARAIKSVHPTLQVGGPATAGLSNIQDFVDDTKNMGIPVDFVSTHSYPSDGYCSRTKDPDCFTKKILSKREIAQKAGYPFLLTEYKDGLQGGPGCAYGGKHGDMSYAAAFILHTIPQLSALDAFSWWTISDIFEEGWLSGFPFYGGYGLLTSQGIAKPAYRAFQMLNGAGDQRINVSISGQSDVFGDNGQASPITVFATTHSSGSTVGAKGLQLFASNFWPEHGATADPRTPNTTTVEVVVNNLPASITSAQLLRVDDNTTNPYTTWLAWNQAAEAAGKCNSQCQQQHCPCLAYLTPIQLAELEAISKPRQELLTVKDGKFSFQIEPYGAINIKFDL